MQALTWILKPAEDTSVDPEHQLRCGKYDTGISVQDATSYDGGYAVNETGGSGDEVWVALLSTHRTLKAAKAAAEKHFSGR
jgi:hypothetical protein